MPLPLPLPPLPTTMPPLFRDTFIKEEFPLLPTNNNNKGPDYVLFDRSLAGFSEDTIQKAKAAQLKLEHFYKAAVDLAIERNNRSVKI